MVLAFPDPSLVAIGSPAMHCSANTHRTEQRQRNRLFTATAALGLAMAMLFAIAAGLYAKPQYPALTGRVVDQAGILSMSDQVALETELATLEGASTDQLAIVTVSSLEGYAIEDYAIGLARQWALGQKDKDNGVLIVVAPNERKVRIEVGRRLEPDLTDTMSKLIIENSILPGFRRGQFGQGLLQGVRDIKDVLLGDTEAVKQRARGKPSALQNINEDELAAILFFIALFLFIMWIQYRASKRIGVKGRKKRGGGIVFFPSGSSGEWRGGWSGGGGRGGGWSGGGGGFGGGGASGSW
jgi:uncharacterized protein